MFQKSPRLPERLLPAIMNTINLYSQKSVHYNESEIQIILEPIKLIVSSLMNNPPLSFGETRMLMLYLTLASGGTSFLLDEPFQGLSNENTELCAGVIRKYADIGATIIITDHNKYILNNISDDIISL